MKLLASTYLVVSLAFSIFFFWTQKSEAISMPSLPTIQYALLSSNVSDLGKLMTSEETLWLMKKPLGDNKPHNYTGIKSIPLTSNDTSFKIVDSANITLATMTLLSDATTDGSHLLAWLKGQPTTLPALTYPLPDGFKVKISGGAANIVASARKGTSISYQTVNENINLVIHEEGNKSSEFPLSLATDQ